MRLKCAFRFSIDAHILFMAVRFAYINVCMCDICSQQFQNFLACFLLVGCPFEERRFIHIACKPPWLFGFLRVLVDHGILHAFV